MSVNSIDVEKAEDDIIDLQNALAGNNAGKKHEIKSLSNFCLLEFI